MNIYELLKYEEGYRAEPYLCSEGYVTVGIGTKLHLDKGLDPTRFCFTVSVTQAEDWLKKELSMQSFSLSKQPAYAGLSNERKAIIQSMAYQMGITGLFNFKKMWKALEEGDYLEASIQMMDSRWAKQTPERAARHSAVMNEGCTIGVYGY